MNRSFWRKLLYGLFFIGLGIAVIGHAVFEWPLGNLAGSWWCILIFVVGLGEIIVSGFRFWSVTLVVFGAWSFGASQDYFKGNSGLLLLSILLIAFGLRIIFGYSHRHHNNGSFYDNSSMSVDTEDFPEYSCVFSNLKVSNNSKSLKGGKASCVFGKMVIDLRDIGIVSNAFFETDCVFGEIEILIPKSVPVRFNITPVFGGYHNKASFTPPDNSSPYLEIKGASVFANINVF